MTNDLIAAPWLRPTAALRSLILGLTADVVTVASTLAEMGVHPLDSLIGHDAATKTIALCLIISAVSKTHLAIARSIAPNVDDPKEKSPS